MHQYASTVVSALYVRSAAGHRYASTVVYALNARSAVVHQSASTVVCALSARSAVVDQSASTVVGEIGARSVVGQEYASTVVSAIHARSAVGLESASTVVGAMIARSARSSERIINQITTSQSVLVFTHSKRTHPPNKSPAVRVNLLVHVELGGFLVTPVQVPIILRRRYHLRPCACSLDLGQHRRLQVRLSL